MDAKPVHVANRLLASLPSGAFEILKPYLKPVQLPHQKVLFETGDSIERVYFPTSGIISLVVGLAGGETIEAAMVGCDGIVGGFAVLDGRISLNKAIVQIVGTALVMDSEKLRGIVDDNAIIRRILLRHEQVLFAQAQQSAACNVTHDIPARLARWLLRSHDLTSSNDMQFTQEFLAQMLGVRRTSISVIAGQLQQAGLIKYRRGHVTITDMEGLKEAACECYGTVHAHYQRLLTPAAEAKGVQF